MINRRITMVGTWSPCLEVVLLAIFLLTAPSCIHPPLLSAPMHCISIAGSQHFWRCTFSPTAEWLEDSLFPFSSLHLATLWSRKLEEAPWSFWFSAISVDYCWQFRLSGSSCLAQSNTFIAWLVCDAKKHTLWSKNFTLSTFLFPIFSICSGLQTDAGGEIMLGEIWFWRPDNF